MSDATQLENIADIQDRLVTHATRSNISLAKLIQTEKELNGLIPLLHPHPQIAGEFVKWLGKRITAVEEHQEAILDVYTDYGEILSSLKSLYTTNE